ncbi:MAG: hypothetical protein J1E40_10225, partial [Oscillospiraceae bacterium]|nr:hypothetical protein [Oscillospiraceae bacterium]
MKKIAVLIISVIMLVTFASCNKLEGIFSGSIDPTNCQLSEFDDELITYLCMNGYDSSDFIISPTALRAALCLAAAGSQANTRTELVSAAGFTSMDAMDSWYAGLKKAEKTFERKTSHNNAYSLANS